MARQNSGDWQDEHNLEYFNDRYLAYVIPIQLRRLVGQACINWFSAGHADPGYPQCDVPASSPVIKRLTERLDSALCAFTSLVQCWMAQKKDESQRLAECSHRLREEVNAFFKSFQMSWGDERHRCHMAIEENDGVEFGLPEGIDNWDCFGTYTVSCDTRGKSGSPHLVISNARNKELLGIAIISGEPSKVLQQVREKGWLNNVRKSFSKAAAELHGCLPTPHRELFELGCLLGDVFWGEYWHRPKVDPANIQTLNTQLPKDLQGLFLKLWFWFPNELMELLQRLRNCDECLTGSLLCGEIEKQCHRGLYRAKLGWFDSELESAILAYDLFQLWQTKDVDNAYDQKLLITIYQNISDLAKTTQGQSLREVTTFDFLKKRADNFHPQIVCLKAPYAAYLESEKSVKPALESWERLKLRKHNGKYSVSLDKKDFSITQNQYFLLFELIEAKGGVITALEIAQRRMVKGEFKLTRHRDTLPKPIKDLIEPTTGTGTKLRSNLDTP